MEVSYVGDVLNAFDNSWMGGYPALGELIGAATSCLPAAVNPDNATTIRTLYSNSPNDANCEGIDDADDLDDFASGPSYHHLKLDLGQKCPGVFNIAPIRED